MRVIGFLTPGPVETLREYEVNDPFCRPHDLLVEVKAVSVNPVDTKVRQSRTPPRESPVVLGWDAAGVVRQVGAEVQTFKPGDEVWYAGDFTREGSNSPYQVVDSRLVALKPRSLDFAQAAALPLTALTAYEALFERLRLPKDAPFKLLIIGGAGGVGSMAIQLAKAFTHGHIVATAGRPESREWALKQGADEVLDRHHPIAMRAEYVFSTTHTADYLQHLEEVIDPFGFLCLIDDPPVLDISKLKLRSIGVLWESVFTKSFFTHAMESQGRILGELAALVDAGKLKTTMNQVLHGLTVENVVAAHRSIEAETSIGKTVIVY